MATKKIFVLWNEDTDEMSVVDSQGYSASRIEITEPTNIEWIPGRDDLSQVGSTGRFKIIDIVGLPYSDFGAQHWCQYDKYCSPQKTFSYTIVVEDSNGRQKSLDDPQIENKSGGGSRYDQAD